MIAKLRIWLSGVVIRVLWSPRAGPEHKGAAAKYQRAAARGVVESAP